MSLSDPVHFDGRRVDTPTRSYPQVLAALVGALAPDCDRAYALLARPPIAAEAGVTPHPRRVWPTIESAFVPTWTSWANEDDRSRWHRVALPDHAEAVVTLAELTGSVVGSAFVHTLALACDGEWVLVAIPHHSMVHVADDPTVRETVNDALTPFHGALVDPGVSVSWHDGDREFCVADGVLREDGDRSRGWSLADLRRVERTGERALSLRWDRREPTDALQRVVGRLLPTPDPPRRLDLPDAETRDDVADALESFLRAHRPGTEG
jgi:hypothetical protein